MKTYYVRTKEKSAFWYISAKPEKAAIKEIAKLNGIKEDELEAFLR